MSDTEHAPRPINASPTKEFFISMLTRDIPLARAILDLVDNSVDGAMRLRGSGNFDGLWIRVELDGDHFKINDNCGGIPVSTAENYAFRFGRLKNTPSTPGSIGQFGVGMKRAFFKLGRHSHVSSCTDSSRFTMDIDVEQWKEQGEPNNADEWHFEFSSVEENVPDLPPDQVGTTIEITGLYESVAASFSLGNFQTRLIQEMSLAHASCMDKGMAISVNTTPLLYEPATLFVSDRLQPVSVEKTYTGEDLTGEQGPPVRVKLFAGLAERSLHDGGWYVFCNGRLVMRADKTATTIWGEMHNMRQYHPDFAYFRGYAYFDSDDAALLPWTTTKTGIDADSPVFKSVQQEMIELSKPIISFLSNLSKETAAVNSGDGTDRILDQAIKNTQAKRIDELELNPMFVAPQRNLPPGPRMQRIQYWRPFSDVEKAKQLLKVSTFTAVGEKTFDYYMEYEEED